MRATIRITIEPDQNLVRWNLAGKFEYADVLRLERERRSAIERLGLPPNEHLSLCDVSACLLSTEPVVLALQEVIGDPRYRSKRCAMVVPGAVPRDQARTVVARDDVAMFDSVAEAEAWLLADSISSPLRSAQAR